MPKKQNFGEPIDRLLRSYEAVMQFLTFVTEVFAKDAPGQFVGSFWSRMLNGPIKHWRSLRTALLNVHTDGFDVEKYVGPSIYKHTPIMQEFEFSPFRWLPTRVAEWTKSSRRVYRIPKDLQLLLAATSLKDVDWKMVNWPFDSFLISLEEPLIFGEETVDAILITREVVDGHELKVIGMVSTDMPTMETVFIGDQCSRIEKAIRKGRPESLAYARKKLVSAMKRIAGGGTTWCVNKSCFDPQGLASTFEEDIELAESSDEILEARVTLRIVFGLLLYLQSRPATELVPRGWQASIFERREGPDRLIRLPSEVSLVKSIYSLNQSEREALAPILRGGYVEAAPHHREGHWRRPPGRGDDPDHPKTVWVRPTIVRRDKLAEGALPQGSTKVI